MKYSTICYLAMCMLLFVVCAGCGSNSKEGGARSKNLSASAPCISCHAEMYSPNYKDASGNPLPGFPTIAAQYQESLHSVSDHGPSCGDCHGVSVSTHPAGAPAPDANPDASGKCYDCHKDYLKYAKGHYYNYTGVSAIKQAVYVSKNYEKSCTSCHIAHNPKPLQENRDWAESGHGDVNGVAWIEQDFKANPQCIRCHTATGFINFVTAKFTNPFPTASWATAGDPTREVLTCKACHLNYNFKNSVRPAPAFIAPYNNNLNPVTFPDVGYSNLCNACHSARENMDTLKAVKDFTNVGFKNSHYLAASGLMYMKTGFTEFALPSTVIAATPSYTYADSFTMFYATGTAPAGNISSTHRKLGTTLINGDSHNLDAFTPGNFDSGGPCVTCHLNASGQPNRGTSHTLAINANTFNQVCINCHKTEGVNTLTGATFKTLFLEEQSKYYQNALALAKTVLLKKYNIKFNGSTYPYFYDLTKDASGKTAVTDWTRGTKDNALGLKVMGACFNINLLSREPGAFVHARSYTRRLLYDTIDFLDDGVINMSVSATAVATDPANYIKGATTAESSGSFNYIAKLTKPERP